VRHSSGGLRYVKGAGFMVEGKAQVSMNLTNFKKTSIPLVVETIRREAQRYGVGIEKSELIGLIPQDAVEDAAAWYLQLDDFDREQVLERRMQSAQEAGEGQSIQDFLAELAAATPTPGGGSAAAQSGALAAALVGMVARLSVGKKKYAEVEAQMAQIAEQADRLRAAFSAAAIRDAQAFEAVMAAFKLPKGIDKEKSARQKAIRSATLEAARVPLEVAGMAVECLALAEQAAELGNTNAITDAGSAAALAAACLEGAGLNVRINLASLKADKQTEQIAGDLRQLEARAEQHRAQVRQHMAARGGFSLS
jgi:glutamate formiminotransferase/formiminotetrahydrofolate cyclodeaminase